MAMNIQICLQHRTSSRLSLGPMEAARAIMSHQPAIDILSSKLKTSIKCCLRSILWSTRLRYLLFYTC